MKTAYKICGKDYNPVPEHIEYSQPLVYAWGERTTGGGTLEAKIEVESLFDISLRKFITKVNGTALSVSREPQVDTSSLVVSINTQQTSLSTSTYPNNVDSTENGGEWKSSNGKWWYDLGNNKWPSNTWKKINGEWYYFDGDGWMLTGWQNIGGKYYYLTPDSGSNQGKRKANTWVSSNNKKYFVGSDGAMLTNAWHKEDNKWYYFNDSGVMVTGTVTIKGKSFVFNSNGSLKDESQISTTAIYNHPKDPVEVKNGDTVEYTIRVYNEGPEEAQASAIRDYIPSDLGFTYDDSLNVTYQWKAYDKSGRDYRTLYIIDSLYDELADRKPDANGRNTWYYNIIATRTNMNSTNANQLEKTIYGLVCGLLNEPTENRAKVTRWYTNLLKRMPSEAEIEEWVNKIDAAGNAKKVFKEEFMLKQEAKTQYIALLSRTVLGSYEMSQEQIENNASKLSQTSDFYKLANNWYLNYAMNMGNNGTYFSYRYKQYINTAAEVYYIETNYEASKTLAKYANGDSLDSRDVKVSLKVKESAPKDQNLVNIAEISSYAKDIDSTPNNFPSSKINNNYTGKGKSSRSENYIEGQEDDDDFDVVYTKGPKIGPVNVSVEKVWDDNDNAANKRLSGVKIKLYANGTLKATVTLSDANNWKYEWKNLARYDANNKKIKYTVEEDFDSLDYSKKIELIDSSETDALIKISYRATNTYIDRTPKNVMVEKKWEDGDDIASRPTMLSVTLLNASTNEPITKDADGNNIEPHVNLEASKNWIYKWENLPTVDENNNEITYTVREEKVEGYTFEGIEVGERTSGSVKFILLTLTNSSDKYTKRIVSKEWVDGDNKDSLRPTSIKAVLKAGDTVVKKDGKGNNITNPVTLNKDNGWTYTWKYLAKTDSNGNEITYTVEEQEIPTGYKVDVSTEGTTTTIINTEITSVSVEKVWVDGNRNTRPSSIKVVLKAGDTDKQTVTLKPSNNWKYTWSDLPKYDSNGNEIVYTVDEREVPEGYELEKEESEAGTGATKYKLVTLTNTLDIYTNFAVEKKWVDSDNKAGIRPTSIKAVLKADGVVVTTDADGNAITNPVTLKASNNWKYKWTLLPKTNANGQTIKYTVNEETVPEGYTAKISSGTITNIASVEKSVEKKWVDGDNKDNTRPTSIQAVLKIGDTLVTKNAKNQTITNPVSLNADNNWKYTWKDLPKYDSEGKEIVYTINEQEVPSGYVAEVSNGTITNTAVVNKSVVKKWVDADNKDNIRPTSIQAVLKVGDTLVTKNAKGETITNPITLNADNNWKYTWKNLPKYDSDGNEIEYTINEQKVPTGYNATISGSTITNTATVTKSVEKNWVDANNKDNIRPTSIKAVLKVGDTLVTKNAKGETITNPVTLKESNNWKYTWKNLPKYDSNGNEIVYTINEQEVPSGYVAKVESDTITNTAAIEIPVEKIWADGDNQDQARPNSVTVTLKDGQGNKVTKNALGEDITNPVTLNADNNWKQTWKNLPKYDSNGNVINYTLEEEAVNHYTSNIVKEDGKFQVKFTLTNTENYDKISVEKVWEDYDNQNKKRPGQVVISLYADGEKKGSITLNNGNNWKGEFTNLPKYNGNKLIEYTVKENTVKNYIADIQEVEKGKFEIKFKVTNTELIDMGGKVWLDNPSGKQNDINNIEDENDTRLSGITVKLFRNGELVGTTKTNKNGQYTFSNQLITGDYQVAFEYDGQQYMPVSLVELSSKDYANNKSAGAENKDASIRHEGFITRETLNARFYEIVKDTAKNKDGQTEIPLKYTTDTEKHITSVNRTTKDFINNATIQASTATFKGNAKYIEYINLGLYLRPQSGVGLLLDVKDVTMSINGVTETKKYGKKKAVIEEDMGAKVAALTDPEIQYNQGIYNSDYNFRIEDYNGYTGSVGLANKNELEVSVTYTLKYRNIESSDVTVTELTMYFDDSYEYVSSTCDKINNKANNVTWTIASGTKSWSQDGSTGKYKTMKTSSINGITVKAGEYVNVDVTFNVKKKSLEIADRHIILGSKYVFAEVSGYKTEDGLIDKYSAPSNLNVSSNDNFVKTFEADSDRAFISLNLRGEDNPRTLTGYVFEDKATGTDADGVEIGDGIRQSTEALQNGVIVQLIEQVEIGGKTYEYIWQEATTGSNKVDYMDRQAQLHSGRDAKDVGTVNKGYYRFSGYLPGNYIVRFIYGDKVVNKKVAVSGQDYKSTVNKGFGNNTSSAEDIKDRRWKVMQYSQEQSFVISSILSNNPTAWANITPEEMTEYVKSLPDGELKTSLNGKTVTQAAQEILKYYTWMAANTGSFKIGIEDAKPKTNINLGVIQRPIAELTVDKTISSIKVVTANSVPVDTERGIGITLTPETSKNPHLELDTLLLNGAEMEVAYDIKITNTGKKDTLYNYFGDETKAITGITTDPHAAISKTAAKLVFDYPQNISFDQDINNVWVEVEKDSADFKKLSENVQDNIKTTDSRVMVVKPTGDGEKLYVELLPNASTETVKVKLNTIMAIGEDEDLVFDNMVEVVTATNTVGRRADQSIFGNYKPYRFDTEPVTGKRVRKTVLSASTEPDTDETMTRITDPTGLKSTPHYEIWIGAAALIIIGIVLIKVKVLKKKD